MAGGPPILRFLFWCCGSKHDTCEVDEIEEAENTAESRVFEVINRDSDPEEQSALLDTSERDDVADNEGPSFSFETVSTAANAVESIVEKVPENFMSDDVKDNVVDGLEHLSKLPSKLTEEPGAQVVAGQGVEQESTENPETIQEEFTTPTEAIDAADEHTNDQIVTEEETTPDIPEEVTPDTPEEITSDNPEATLSGSLKPPTPEVQGPLEADEEDAHIEEPSEIKTTPPGCLATNDTAEQSSILSTEQQSLAAPEEIKLTHKGASSIENPIEVPLSSGANEPSLEHIHSLVVEVSVQSSAHEHSEAELNGTTGGSDLLDSVVENEQASPMSPVTPLATRGVESIMVSQDHHDGEVDDTSDVTPMNGSVTPEHYTDADSPSEKLAFCTPATAILESEADNNCASPGNGSEASVQGRFSSGEIDGLTPQDDTLQPEASTDLNTARSSKSSGSKSSPGRKKPKAAPDTDGEALRAAAAAAASVAVNAANAAAEAASPAHASPGGKKSVKKRGAKKGGSSKKKKRQQQA